MIAVSADRLAKLKQSVDACLGAALAARVGYFTPDQFILHLQRLAAEDSKPPPPIAPGEKIYGKYKVKSKSVPLTPAEAQEREDQACRVIAETLRQSKGA